MIVLQLFFDSVFISVCFRGVMAVSLVISITDEEIVEYLEGVFLGEGSVGW